jgi:hypothetical protein
MTFKLLAKFEATFRDGPYLHRDSTLGNRIADHLYEDLFDLGLSKTFNSRVEAGTRVLNPKNTSPGISARRGDGSFGELVPGTPSVLLPGYAVQRGQTANVEIGAEVKILAKTMVRQIGRVVRDLRDQANELREKGADAITLGIAGINFADHYVSYEAATVWATDGSHRRPHPASEGDRAEEHLRARAEKAYDEFLYLGFKAANEPPYDFDWVRLDLIEQRYAAILVRILRLYDKRF